MVVTYNISKSSTVLFYNCFIWVVDPHDHPYFTSLISAVIHSICLSNSSNSLHLYIFICRTYRNKPPRLPSCQALAGLPNLLRKKMIIRKSIFVFVSVKRASYIITITKLITRVNHF